MMKVLLALFSFSAFLRELPATPVFQLAEVREKSGNAHLIEEVFECPADGVFPVPNECTSSYYLCSAGDAYEESCPVGYLFDPLTLNCVTEEQASCLTTTPPPTTTTTEMPTTTLPTTVDPTTRTPFNCPGDGLWPSVEQGCSNSYWSCTDGVATLQNCQNAMVFDPETQNCKLPANVPSCNVLFL